MDTDYFLDSSGSFDISFCMADCKNTDCQRCINGGEFYKKFKKYSICKICSMCDFSTVCKSYRGDNIGKENNS